MILLGTAYRVNDLEKLPQELHGENISCVTNRESYGFFGKLHPFSNFYATKFEFQGYDYHSSEQRIQHLKATYFGDEEQAQKILNANTALECKRLSKGIAQYNHEDWCSIAKNMCESGIKVKFDQNPKIKKKFLETKGKTLVECSMDYVWGTGIPINDNEALCHKRSVNQGILGEMLQELLDDTLEYKESERVRNESNMITSKNVAESTKVTNA